MGDNDKWSKTGAIWAIIGVIVAIIFGIIALVTPEIRCFTHLDGPDKCQSSSSSNSQSNDVRNAIVDASPDPNLPYSINAPAAHGIPGEEASIELDVYSIVNRGRAVPVTLSGQGFFANSYVKIEWYGPDGGTYIATGADTDDRGLFRDSLLWLPERDAGVKGNDGAWKMYVNDTSSGSQNLVQVTVTSDSKTPPPDEWPTRQTWNPKPHGPATVSAGVSGYLCEGAGAQSSVHAEGFTPEAGLQVDYLRPDGQRVALTVASADGVGSIDDFILYWKTQNCTPQSTFTYKVVVVEPATGRKASSSLIFTNTQH